MPILQSSIIQNSLDNVLSMLLYIDIVYVGIPKNSLSESVFHAFNMVNFFENVSIEIVEARLVYN